MTFNLLQFLYSAFSKKAFGLLISIGFSIIVSTLTPLFAQSYLDPSISIDERIEDLISRMTLEEKVGQMTQLDITMINNERQQSDVSLNPEKARVLLTEHHIGSFLNGEAV
ncbi:MAG TPA: hypothetical protein VJ878_03605, partial [Candidatus Izemoplasmatales bacterium]|nr:hypothetical protein [Candidatus Izemoplasmatales bacterium]